MKIGIDIDNTLLSSGDYFEYIKKRDNINFNKKFGEKWSDEEHNKFLPIYLKEIIKNSKLKPGAKEVLDYLHDKGNKLIIITARNNIYYKDTKKLTKKVLLDYGIKMDDIYFDAEKKSDLAQKLGIDLMIDDNKNVYENMKKENIDCILFGSDIKSWKEVLNYIESR